MTIRKKTFHFKINKIKHLFAKKYFCSGAFDTAGVTSSTDFFYA